MCVQPTPTPLHTHTLLHSHTNVFVPVHSLGCSCNVKINMLYYLVLFVFIESVCSFHLCVCVCCSIHHHCHFGLPSLHPARYTWCSTYYFGQISTVTYICSFLPSLFRLQSSCIHITPIMCIRYVQVHLFSFHLHVKWFPFFSFEGGEGWGGCCKFSTLWPQEFISKPATKKKHPSISDSLSEVSVLLSVCVANSEVPHVAWTAFAIPGISIIAAVWHFTDCVPWKHRG